MNSKLHNSMREFFFVILESLHMNWKQTQNKSVDMSFCLLLLFRIAGIRKILLMHRLIFFLAQENCINQRLQTKIWLPISKQSIQLKCP